jgi:hypothetical protein
MDGLDEYTFAIVVVAAASLLAMCSGKPLHVDAIKARLERSVFVTNTLLNMYFTN